MIQVMKRVLLLLKKRRKNVLLLSIANLLFAILVLVEPIFFKQVIDILIGFSESSSGTYNTLVYTLLLWIII